MLIPCEFSVSFFKMITIPNHKQKFILKIFKIHFNANMVSLIYCTYMLRQYIQPRYSFILTSIKSKVPLWHASFTANMLGQYIQPCRPFIRMSYLQYSVIKWAKQRPGQNPIKSIRMSIKSNVPTW